MKSFYRFERKIYITNKDEQVNKTPSINIYSQKSKLSLPTPFNAFLLEYDNKKLSTRTQIADIMVGFLNYVFFNPNNPIHKFEELTLQHAIDYLSNLNVVDKVKRRYSQVLSHFYYFTSQQDICIFDDIIFEKKINRNTKEYIGNIFEGKYKKSNKIVPECIHEIDLAYLPLLFQVCQELHPDILLGFYFQFAGGLRVSEVVSIEYSNIRQIKNNGTLSLSISLNDKDLRPDLQTSFINQVKRNRSQYIMPIFGDSLETTFIYHKQHFRKNLSNAVFLDNNNKPMTEKVYRNRFNHVKKEFIKRLFESNDFNAKTYAIYLSSYRWSTHIGRGTYSNIVAQNANNIGEIAIARGDMSLGSSLPYLNDNKSVEQKVKNTFDEFYKGGENHE